MQKEAYLVIDDGMVTDILSLHDDLDAAKQVVLKSGLDSRKVVVFKDGKPAEWIGYRSVYREYRKKNPLSGQPIEIEILEDLDEENPDVVGRATLPDGTVLSVEVKEANWYYLEKHQVDVIYGIYLYDDDPDNSRVDAYVAQGDDYQKYLRKPQLLKKAESYVAIKESVTEDYHAIFK